VFDFDLFKHTKIFAPRLVAQRVPDFAVYDHFDAVPPLINKSASRFYNSRANPNQPQIARNRASDMRFSEPGIPMVAGGNDEGSAL
jgi:hypothetical protein